MGVPDNLKSLIAGAPAAGSDSAADCGSQSTWCACGVNDINAKKVPPLPAALTIARVSILKNLEREGAIAKTEGRREARGKSL